MPAPAGTGGLPYFRCYFHGDAESAAPGERGRPEPGRGAFLLNLRAEPNPPGGNLTLFESPPVPGREKSSPGIGKAEHPAAAEVIFQNPIIQNNPPAADNFTMSSFPRPLTVFMFLILTIFAPAIKLPAWEQSGTASWYGGIFQGRTTANGETYDTNGYTAAHKTLPFGTILEVTNLGNNLKVKVRVNDRGPFVDDRIIDLTYAAAKDIDMIRDGTARVRIVALGDSLQKVLFNVQIGAWGELENALAHRMRLSEAGLQPKAELGSDGITRIFIPDVKEENVYALVNILENLGYEKLFIQQIRDTR
jgi:rare lipoprotein A